MKGIDYLQRRVSIRCWLGDPNWVEFRLKAGGSTTIMLTSSDGNIYYPYFPLLVNTVKWNSLVYEISVESDEYDNEENLTHVRFPSSTRKRVSYNKFAQ